MMGDEKFTGTKDKTYDVVVCLQRSLEDALRYNMFAKDAEREGDKELAGFFKEVAQKDQDFAERCKKLLNDRL